MGADPWVVPIGCQVAPPSVVAQRPFFATPAISVFERGTADSSVRLPHSDCMLAKLLVAFPQPSAATAEAEPSDESTTSAAIGTVVERRRGKPRARDFMLPPVLCCSLHRPTPGAGR